MFIKPLRFDPAIPLFLHSAEGDGGGDGKTPTETPEQRAEKIAAEVQAKFEAQSAKHSGDLTAALLDQIRKTHSAENGSKTLQQRVNELQQQVPDEATRAKWAAYEALGTPDELKQRLETGDAAVQKSQILERDKVVKDDLKLTPNDLLNTLLNGTQLVGEGEGEARKVFAVEGDVKTPWEEFVESNPALKQALPALTVTPQPAQGTPHFRQVSGEQKVVALKPADEFIAAKEQQNKEKKNPLMG